MKNSKEYSQKTHKLYRQLKRKYPKPKKVIYDDPVEAIVYAIISENISEPATQSAMRRFADYFVDLNDLRVARMEEIIEVLGEDTPLTRDTTSALIRALAFVFSKHNMVCLKALEKIGKRPARQALEQIDGTSAFVVNYCMLTSLQAHAIPLTAKMVEFLRTNELVHPDADTQQIEGFLTRQISAENAYEFYILLRRHSEKRKTSKKKKTTRKTKPKTKKKTRTAKKKK